MAAFQLSCDGTPFVVPTADLLARVRRWMRTDRRPLVRMGDGVSPNLDLDSDNAHFPADVDLYELFVPTGASRFGFFRGLMAAADVAALTGTGPRSRYYDSGSGLPRLQSCVFRMGVVPSTTITRTMYLLPPVPLTGLGGSADAYLVTLVDDRYWGQFGTLPTGGLSGWGFNNTWQALIQNLLNQSLGSSAVSYPAPWPPAAAYGQPDLDSDFYTFGSPVGPMADAALASVGRVLCGDYAVVRWADANAAAAAARTANAAARIAGGALWPLHQAGGTELALVAHLPNTVQVVFPHWITGSGYAAATLLSGPILTGCDPRPHSSDGEYGQATVLAYTPADLGSPYDSLVTDSGTPNGASVTLRTTAKAVYPANYGSGGGVTNLAAMQDLAKQLAMDFYDCQSQAVVETYRGLVAFDPRAALDVTYAYWPEPMTRISRRPLNAYPTRFGHGFGDVQAFTRGQLVKITGAVSGGFYPGALADSGPLGTSLVVDVLAPNGEALTPGLYYLGIRMPSVSANPMYYVPNPAPALGVGSTLVNGGSAGNVLYTDGSALQGAGNLDIAGTSGPGSTPTVFVQAASGKWVSFGVGSF
jgi:hypothetical protein